VAAALGLGCHDQPPRVAYDLLEGAEAGQVVNESTTIDVGSPASRPQLVAGFSWSERAGDGSTFSWSAGGESIARFELFSTEPRLVALRGFRFEAPGAEGAQAVEVRLNGAVLGTLEADPGPGTWALDAPREALRLGPNHLALRYSHTHRRRAGARAGREIAVAWDALALLPADPFADAAARLDAALASLSAETEVPRVDRRGLHLPAGTALRWALDAGPGAMLRLLDLRFGRQPAGGTLAVWLEVADGPARLLADVAPPARSLAAPLALDRFGTVRLTIAATRRDERPPQDAVLVGRARVVYPPIQRP
jgi:hypothetical protein